MKSARRSPGFRGAACAVALAALFTLAPRAAEAVTLPITFEFDDGVEGDYGTLRVEENGSGGLAFEITLGPDLGPDADLHYLYFNLLGNPSDLDIASSDAVTTAYSVSADSSVRGGAGSDFDYAVFFGNGAGPRGNGNLAHATFTIFSPSVALSLDDLFEMSSTSQGLESNFAVHVQSTSTGGGSETVGAVIPEPTTAALLVVGLLGLAFAGHRSS